MKKYSKFILIIIILTIFTFKMPDLIASTWTCTYHVQIQRVLSENEYFEFIFEFDSKTGLKKDFTIKCGDDYSNLSKVKTGHFNNSQGDSSTLCGITILYGGFGTPDTEKTDYYNVNQKSLASSIDGSYVCPSPTILDLATTDDSTQYDLTSIEHWGEYALELYSAVNDDPNATYTCSNENPNGTCPEGQTCTSHEISTGVEYYCETDTGEIIYDDVCDAVTVAREAYGAFTRQCYTVQYVKNDNQYAPIIKRYSNGKNCSGELLPFTSAEFDSSRNAWIVDSSFPENAKYPDKFVLPVVTKCSEAPTSSDLVFDEYNVCGSKYLIDDSLDLENVSCGEIIGDNGKILVKIFITAIRIIAPVLLFVFTAFEFMKAIPSQDQDIIIKTWKRFGTRGIITVLIMLLPTFMNILGRLVGIFENCDIW